MLFDPEFHIPLVGRWDVLGFLQDFFAVAVLLGIIDVRDHPAALGAQGVRPRRRASTARTPAAPG